MIIEPRGEDPHGDVESDRFLDVERFQSEAGIDNRRACVQSDFGPRFTLDRDCQSDGREPGGVKMCNRQISGNGRA